MFALVLLPLVINQFLDQVFTAHADELAADLPVALPFVPEKKSVVWHYDNRCVHDSFQIRIVQSQLEAP